MAYSTSRLEIIIDSITGERRLRRLRGELGAADRAGTGLGSALKAAILPLASLISVAGGVSKLTAVSREFDVINASLITATGSAANAETAFRAIQDFAATTPYALQEVANAFVKLRNMGLEPSEAALTSYGNTAAAMGKSLNDMIEAVADAATGEFERLKEFGIRASAQGDQVEFTFQGVSTTVQKEAGAIEGYLRNLGNLNFAGAMAERSATLDGAISNLGDTWDSMFLTISQQGAGELIEKNIRRANDALTEITAALASGQVAAYLDAMGGKFYGLTNDIITSFEIINRLIEDSTQGWAENGGDAVDFISDAFSDLPENIRAFAQLITVELAVLDSKFSAYADAFGEYLDPSNWFADTSTLAQGLEGELAIIEKSRLGSITAILSERDESIKAFEADIDAADRARGAYDEAAAARLAAGGDRLAQFAIDSPEEKERKSSKELSKMASGPAYDSLLGMVDAQDRGSQIIAAQQAEFEATRRGLDQKYAIEQAHQDRMQALRDGERQGLIDNEAEMSALVISSTQQRNDELARLEQDRYKVLSEGQQEAMGAIGSAMGNFAEIAKEGGKETFQQYKNLASGQAIIATTLAAVKAYAELPFPANIALSASMAALGAVQVAKIQGQEYVGQAHDGYDYIPKSGTWNLQEGERVIGKELNRDLTQSLERDKKGQSGNSANVTNVFQISTGVSQTVQSEIRSMLPQINEMTQRSVVAAISKGGPMARAVGRK